MKKLIFIFSIILIFMFSAGFSGVLQKVELLRTVAGKLWVTAMPYAWDIAEGNVPRHFALNKFGQNLTVAATEEPIWEYSAAYEYLDDDTFAQMYISSDDNADTGISYTVEGIDCEYNHFSISVDSNGFAFVAIDTGCDGTVYGAGAGDDDFAWRVYRAYCSETNTNPDDACAAGTIYISKDNTDVGGNGIPDTTTDIQAIILTGKKQTNMAQWTVPIGYDAYLTDYYASSSVLNKVSEVDLYIRPFGGVFRSKKPISINAGYSPVPYNVPLSVSARSDIVIRGLATGGGGKISAGFSGWYEN